MSNTVSIRLVIVVVVALGLGGCGDEGPTVGPSPTPGSTPAPAPPPIPGPAVQPVVSAVVPNVVSVEGGAWSTVTGSGFQAGAAFLIDGRAVPGQVIDSTSAVFWPVAHAPGAVDVVMTNPGGLSARLPSGYTFAAPASFDFNGEWTAHAGNDYDTDMQLSIRDGVHVSVSCGAAGVQKFTLSQPFHDGRFSYTSEDGLSVSGKLLSPVTANGTIDAPGCRGSRWWADKRQP